MEQLLSPFQPFLGNLQFIKAVDGKTISAKDMALLFDQELAYQRYGRNQKLGEIGCTLSHRKCFQHLLDSNEETAFIMEDDILFWVSPQEFGLLLQQLKPHLSTSEPTIVILFGEYWYTASKKLNDKYQLKTVYDAISAQGYLINRAAATRLLQDKASFLADDWTYIISKGVRVKALFPHIIDQEWSSFETTVSTDGYGAIVRKNLSAKNYLHSYWRGGIKHLLKAIGHFDPHQIPEGTPEWALRLGI